MFSKGTWSLSEQNGEILADGHRIAKVDGATVHNYEDNAEEYLANARLIVAAPEMYGELYEALQLCKGKSSYEGDDFWEQAESISELLARIDGEETEA